MWVDGTLSHNGTKLAWQFHVEFVVALERHRFERARQLQKRQTFVMPTETRTYEFSRLDRALVVGHERFVDAVCKGGIAHR